MWKQRSGVFLLSVVLLLAACQTEQPSPSIEAINISPVAASVNGTNIYESDIDAEMANMPASMLQYRQDPKLRKKILSSLIRRQVVSQKAELLGLDRNPIVKKRMLAAQGQILIEAAKSWQLAHMQPIQDTEIQAYYGQHKDEFRVPAQAHARHILVRTEKQAWNILQKLRHNRSLFAQLAASQSLDTSNNTRSGDLNWFSRGTMVKVIEDTAFSLKPHGLSKPIKTKLGWHVIELVGKRAASQKTLDVVRAEIISSLQHQRLDQWYQELEQASKVVIKPVEYQ